MPARPPDPALLAVDLRRMDGGTLRVDGLGLSVLPGELVGLVGPNGGGKSTALSLLAGLLRPTRGAVQVGGRPVRAAAARGEIGLLSARPGLYPLLTGRENLAFYAALWGIDRDGLRARLARLPPTLRATEALDRPAAVLSSGQAQKLGLARALLLDPAVLLLDEPTANRDPVAARDMLARIRAQADAGRAVVWVSHDLAAVERLADRVVVLAVRPAATLRFDPPRELPPAGALLHAYAAATAGAVGDAVSAPGEGIAGPRPAPPARHGGAGRRLRAVIGKELREHGRQPGMLLAMAGVLGGIAALCLGTIGLLQLVAGDPEGAARLAGNLRFFGLPAQDPVTWAVSGATRALAVLGLTQALGMAAVLGGQGVLQDRATGALPFLVLGPLRRWELLLAKATAATLTPWALYLGIVGGAGLLVRCLPVSAGAAASLPPSPGWLAGALLSGPAWALAVASLGGALSVRARDARGAQQGVWAVVFLVVLGLAGALGLAELAGPAAHLPLALAGLAVAGVGVGVGAALLARDVPR